MQKKQQQELPNSQNIMATILTSIPKEAAVTRIDYEGPRIALYTKAPRFLMENSSIISNLVNEIKKLIKDSIPDAIIEIKDLMGDSNHYAATIKSSLFNNLSKIEQHKLVYKSLKGKMGNELHALSITTRGK